MVVRAVGANRDRIGITNLGTGYTVMLKNFLKITGIVQAVTAGITGAANTAEDQIVIRGGNRGLRRAEDSEELHHKG
jgi:hypothetical protein